MQPTRFLSRLLLICALGATSAFGQAQRTLVSRLGTDSNPCSRTAPCRALSQAVSQTNAGGDVVMLDSAGYGPATITKAITIAAPEGGSRIESQINHPLDTLARTGLDLFC